MCVYMNGNPFHFFFFSRNKKTERAYFYVWLSTLYLAFFGSSNIFVFAVSWFCLWIFCAKRLHSSFPFFGYTKICNLVQNASIASKLKVKSSDLQSHCIRKFHEVECTDGVLRILKQKLTNKQKHKRNVVSLSKSLTKFVNSIASMVLQNPHTLNIVSLRVVSNKRNFLRDDQSELKKHFGCRSTTPEEKQPFDNNKNTKESIKLTKSWQLS